MECDKALFFALGARDWVTMGHSRRVASHVARMAEAWGLKREEVDVFYQTGLLHDIGKIGISDRLLKSREKYTRADWKEMKKHAYIGGTLLKSLGFAEEVVTGAMYHHERFDGNGYPRGLAGGEIPLIARMIAVADTFDALTSYRPYRNPVDPGLALEIMVESEGQFDSDVLDTFIEMWLAKPRAAIVWEAEVAFAATVNRAAKIVVTKEGMETVRKNHIEKTFCGK